jgi:hypothetical protein
MDINVENVLIIVIVASMFYHVMVYGVKRRCSYKRESFNVGGQVSQGKTSKKCTRALLETLCFTEENCDVCIGTKQRKLRSAGCTQADISNYCSKDENCDETLNMCKKTNLPCHGCHRCSTPYGKGKDKKYKFNCGCRCN